jgi:hypothetical protein
VPGQGSNKHINKKERKRKCLPPRKVSLHPTHSLANKEMGALTPAFTLFSTISYLITVLQIYLLYNNDL